MGPFEEEKKRWTSHRQPIQRFRKSNPFLRIIETPDYKQMNSSTLAKL
jgi:hypothetical protein